MTTNTKIIVISIRAALLSLFDDVILLRRFLEVVVNSEASTSLRRLLLFGFSTVGSLRDRCMAKRIRLCFDVGMVCEVIASVLILVLLLRGISVGVGLRSAACSGSPCRSRVRDKASDMKGCSTTAVSLPAFSLYCEDDVFSEILSQCMLFLLAYLSIDKSNSSVVFEALAPFFIVSPVTGDPASQPLPLLSARQGCVSASGSSVKLAKPLSFGTADKSVDGLEPRNETFLGSFKSVSRDMRRYHYSNLI